MDPRLEILQRRKAREILDELILKNITKILKDEKILQKRECLDKTDFFMKLCSFVIVTIFVQ